MAIPVDARDRTLLLHRSDNVRSARNVWSFPSGLHEIGETRAQCAYRELKEEFGLVGLEGQFLELGAYENIAGDAEAGEQYHWVLSVFLVRVGDVEQAVNREPDKHDIIAIRPVWELLEPGFFQTFPFHASFMQWVGHARIQIASRLSAFQHFFFVPKCKA